jgi:penicillin-binding protein 1A
MMNNFLRSLKLQFVQVYLFFKPFTFRKFLVLGSLLFGSMVLFVFILFVLVWSGALGSLPSKTDIASVENPAASEVYSADSVLLGRYFIQERSNIEFNEIPSHVADAATATEDVRFYEHNGIDTRSLGRVLVKSLLLQNESSGGGSTITQQLAKNLYPRKEYWFFSLFINKIREMIIARRLEKVYDKQALLTLYLNTIPFGDNTFGLEAAAQRFFSVHTKNLSIEQGAVLIGMLKATRSYNPRLYPKQSLNRRNVVLSQMTKYKILTPHQYDSLKALPIVLRYNKITHHEGPASYFREYLRPELLAWCKKYNETHDTEINLYTSGLKIYTTIDSRLQRYAEEAVARQMKETQKRFDNHWANRNPWQHYPTLIEEAIQKTDRYKALKKQGLSEAEIQSVLNKPVPTTVFSWDGEQEKNLSPIDSIKHYLKFLNAGFLAMDPKTGAIRAWVGGINHHYFQFDHVRESTKRQVGSTFKPIVYATALEQGVKPCSFISAEKTTYTNMEDWAPENTEDNYGLKYSMPGALVYSVNTVSVQLLEKAGIANAINLARAMGIKSELQAVPSIALGTPNISMTEMVQAYSAFANNGNAATSHYITAITHHDHKTLERFKNPETHRAMSADNAQLILHMLKRVVNEGTAASLRSQFGLRVDIGGKTGTTQSNTDGWFIGVTPNLVIGSWVGADDPRIRFRSTALGQGSRTALPIVGDFLRSASQDTELHAVTQARFPALSNSLERKIDCDLFKEDTNLIKRIFGDRDKDKEKKKEFGKKEKKGFLKRLFEKDK